MSKVLVIDDSPTEIFQFKLMLERLGHEVITAENGHDGVALAIKEQPDREYSRLQRKVIRPAICTLLPTTHRES